MSPDRDPFELLVAANPVPDESVVVVPADGLARVRARIAARRRRWFRQPRWWAPPVIVVVAASAAAGYVVTRESTEHSAIGCYAEASLDADTAVVSVAPADAVEACAELWREGHVVTGVDDAPPLHACVLPSGAIGVFPGTGEGTCSGIGRGVGAPEPTSTLLPGAPVADRSADPAVVVELTDRLAEASPKGAGCMTPEEARLVVDVLFDALALHQWTVETGEGATGAGFDDERPCASFAVDEEARTVTLVPIPRRGP